MSAIVADIAERTKMEQEQEPSHTAGAGAVVVGIAGSGDNRSKEAAEGSRWRSRCSSSVRLDEEAWLGDGASSRREKSLLQKILGR